MQINSYLHGISIFEMHVHTLLLRNTTQLRSTVGLMACPVELKALPMAATICAVFFCVAGLDLLNSDIIVQQQLHNRLAQIETSQTFLFGHTGGARPCCCVLSRG